MLQAIEKDTAFQIIYGGVLNEQDKLNSSMYVMPNRVDLNVILWKNIVWLRKAFACR